jgi:hypothetical protein
MNTSKKLSAATAALARVFAEVMRKLGVEA